MAKSVEHEVNSIPLGYLTHLEDNAPLLRILMPNFLRLNAGATRSPSTLISIPKDSGDLMSRVKDAYQACCKNENLGLMMRQMICSLQLKQKKK